MKERYSRKSFFKDKRIVKEKTGEARKPVGIGGNCGKEGANGGRDVRRKKRAKKSTRK